MNWRKILALAFFLAALAVAIAWVSRREKQRPVAGEMLLDIPADAVERIELRNANGRFVFFRRDTLWHLEEPLATRADKVALESILDNFCQLKYDRLVAEDSRDLQAFGLDDPEIELKLFAAGRPAAAVLLGVKNGLDDSSYARLAKRQQGGQPRRLQAQRPGKGPVRLPRQEIPGDRRHGRQRPGSPLREKPPHPGQRRTTAGSWKRPSIPWPAPPGSTISSLPPRPWKPCRSPRPATETGSASTSRCSWPSSAAAPARAASRSGKKANNIFARVEGAAEICAIPARLPGKIRRRRLRLARKKGGPVLRLRRPRVFLAPGLFAVHRTQGCRRQLAVRAGLPGKRPGAEKVDALLTALADLEAGEFIDAPGRLARPRGPPRMLTQDPADPGKHSKIVMEFQPRRWGDGHRAQPGAALCLQGRQGDTGEISRETGRHPRGDRGGSGPGK